MYSKAKILVLTLMVFSIVVFNSPVNAASLTGNTSVQVKSKVTRYVGLEEKSVTGQIINNRTYVDLYGLVSCLPLTLNSKALSFDEQSKTFKILGEDLANAAVPVLQFHIGDSHFFYNGEKINMDSRILLVNKRILIPLKPVASVYKLKIEYDKSSNTVSVSE